MVLLGNWRHHQFVALPWLEHCADLNGNKVDLPRDYTIMDATYSWERHSIGIRISHPSFHAVPDGEQDPYLYYREVTIEARPIIKDQTDDECSPIIVEMLRNEAAATIVNLRAEVTKLKRYREIVRTLIDKKASIEEFQAAVKEVTG
jgi:hypothetical protein